MAKRVTDQFTHSVQFTDLLEAAESAKPQGKDGEFVTEIRTSYRRYGAGTFLSDKQKAWLVRIAEDVR